MAAPPKWRPPAEIDEYRIIRQLGSGGMGQVYLAYDTILARHVAVKFISTLDPGPATRRRFLVEARAAARLQHPNVVTIHRVGELDRQPYLVSEFVGGHPLDRLTRPMPWLRALRIGVDLARGLSAAHRHGVLHRDIKPGNAVLADDGSAKLLDFGLAKLFEVLPGTQGSPLGQDNDQDGSNPSSPPRQAQLSSAEPIPPSHVIEARDQGESGAPGDAAEAHAAEPLFVPSDERRLFEDKTVPQGKALGLLAEAETCTPKETGRHQSLLPPEGLSIREPSPMPPALPTPPTHHERELFLGPPAARPADPVHPPLQADAEHKTTIWPPERGQKTLLGQPNAEGPKVEPAMPGTRTGVVLGTPFYIAPEIWRGQGATRRSDVYGLGAVLYELCAGRPPHFGAQLLMLSRVVTETDPPLLSHVVPGIDPRIAAIVDRCLLRDAGQRFASGEELYDALEGLLRACTTPKANQGNPYRGLAPFDAEHRGLFFGRRQEIDLILERLRRDPFVVVTGDSGVGKSSLCRAGLLPLLGEGMLGEGRAWQVLQLSPGRRPYSTLLSTLASVWSNANLFLRRDPTDTTTGSGKGTNPWFTFSEKLGDRAGVVLFIDQLEELITQSDPEETKAMAFALGQFAVGVPGLRLLATARVDFLTRIANLPSFSEPLARALYILRPLSAGRMREAVVGPADITGTRFESPPLIEAIIDQAARGGGSLPLLQFALAELWEARDQDHNLITAEALDRIGGVTGALARHADTVLDGILEVERTAARRLLTRLVTVEGTRARLAEGELIGDDPVARSALTALVRGRLVTVEAAHGESAYCLAHEALLNDWSRLRGWLDDDSERRMLRERLSRAASDWERFGLGREGLWSLRQLAKAATVGLFPEGCSDPELRYLLPSTEAAFLIASRRAMRQSRWQRGLLLSALPLFLIVTYAWVRIHAAQVTDHRIAAQLSTAQKDFEQAQSKARSLVGLRQRALEHFRSGRVAEGETLWSQVLEREHDLDLRHSHISQELEAALALDSTRHDVRRLLADVLNERALLAEDERRTAQRDELLERLSVYDEGTDRLQQWHALARLDVGSDPPGATVTCERYDEKAGQAYRVVDKRRLGSTPLRAVSLPAGSYLLTIERKGSSPVVYPIVLVRGVPLRVTVPLLPEGSVPDGYVYMPPGRFLSGSTYEGSLRRDFFKSLPLHEVDSEAFFIARHEVTYGEWLQFLRRLPAAERRQHLPQVAGGALTGPVGLNFVHGGWQLSLQPAGVPFVVREGEKVRYPKRTVRATQDWLQFPVAGISIADAEAYLDWLRRTRRLPGARLCTDDEWERAARGADARAFPHGDRLEPEDANFDQTYGQDEGAMGPDEVGSHPASRSPFGIDDMCGNVFEWVASSLSPGQFVVRGGSYLYDSSTDEIPNRQISARQYRDANIGLRVCASPMGAVTAKAVRRN